MDLTNTSDITDKPERIALYAALLSDDHLFYVVAVAPDEDLAQYDPTFSKVIESLKLVGHK